MFRVCVSNYRLRECPLECCHYHFKEANFLGPLKTELTTDFLKADILTNTFRLC